MKIFGTISELVKVVFRSGGRETKLDSATQTGSQTDVTFRLPDLVNNSGSAVVATIVEKDLAQVLTNKTIDADLNTLSNIDDNDIKANAGIAYSKLNLQPLGVGAIVDADISPTAAIDYSKLELSPGGIGAIIDGDISASAAISRSKLGLGTASHVVINDGSGNFSSEAQLAKARGGAGADMSSVTFPSVGTLVTRDATETLLNKTTISSTGAATGALTLPAGTTSDRTGLTTPGMIRYNTDNAAFEGYVAGAWSAIGGGGTTDKITQASHGFVLGDVLYLNGSTYAKAIATAANTAEAVGVVSRVIGINEFEITLSGEVTGLSGLVAGEVYFLSAATAGAITTVEPSVIGQVSVPIGVASSITSLYVAPKRGNVLGGTNARSQMPLAAVTTAQTIYTAPAGLDAGELTGWVYLDATTDRKFYISAPFVRNGAGSDWNISPSYVGDTPPTGFTTTITTSGQIQITMNPLPTGFVSGYINYAINAPAVGATFPLAVDASTITAGTIAAARLPQVSSSSQGAFPSLTSSLDNATATQLGLKQYLHGTNYNGGIAPTVTCGQAGFIVERAAFIPYQTQDGIWRVKVSIRAVFTSATLTLVELAINGVSFNTTTQGGSGFWGGVTTPARCYVNSSTLIKLDSPSVTTNAAVVSGDFELAAKPTWAY